MRGGAREGGTGGGEGREGGEGGEGVCRVVYCMDRGVERVVKFCNDFQVKDTALL